LLLNELHPFPYRLREGDGERVKKNKSEKTGLLRRPLAKRPDCRDCVLNKEHKEQIYSVLTLRTLRLLCVLCG
jgi:hypothetical protein